MTELLAKFLVPLALAIIREAMARKDLKDAVIGKLMATMFRNAHEAAEYIRTHPPDDGIIVRPGGAAGKSTQAPPPSTSGGDPGAPRGGPGLHDV